MADNVVVSPLNKGGATLFDKLQHLSSEISEGIVNLSGGKRWLVDMELQHLKEEAQKETSPEATYNLLLFRKYADVANQIKDENAELKTQGVSFPSILPEAGNDEKLLRGLDAMRSNLFWLRVLAALLSFVSFVVMSTVPHVQHAHFHPNSYFEVQPPNLSPPVCVACCLLACCLLCFRTGTAPTIYRVSSICGRTSSSSCAACWSTCTLS